MWFFVTGFSHSILLSRFIHTVARISASFLFVVESYSAGRRTTFCLPIPQLMGI